MDVPQFEQAILKLAFETDARITTASVAYYLGLPSRRCNELLNALLAEGALELDSDAEGNLYYRVPNKPQGSDQLLGKLRREREHPFVASNLLLTGPDTPANPDRFFPVEPPEARRLDAGQPERPVNPGASVRWVSAGQEDDSAPISPRSFGPSTHTPPDDDWYDDGAGRQARAPAQASAAGPTHPRRARRQKEDQEIFAGITRHQARPDASINRCGASPVLVADSVRCDPRPLPTRKPVLTSCAEPRRDSANRRADSIWHTPQSDQWPVAVNSAQYPVFADQGAGRGSMLAQNAGGDIALREDMLSQPEHQPGMALLLSLILCGTGQIYNGEVSKGIMMMVLCFLLWFVLLGWVVHIWSIVDSVVVAERLNRTGS